MLGIKVFNHSINHSIKKSSVINSEAIRLIMSNASNLSISKEISKDFKLTEFSNLNKENIR